SLDLDPAMCELAGRWIARADLRDFVEIAEGSSLDAASVEAARKYLGDDPELIVLDSSHEHRSTLAELDLWYPALAPGGLLVLHDVSEFAAGFDVTGEGGEFAHVVENQEAAGRERGIPRSEEHTSELQSQSNTVCRL